MQKDVLVMKALPSFQFGGISDQVQIPKRIGALTGQRKYPVGDD
jgi:hypothetical protein